MSTKLSRILGIIGGALAMLPYVAFAQYFNINMFFNDEKYAYCFSLLYFIPALLSSAGLIAALYVRKNPLAAGMVMIISSGLNFIFPPTISSDLDVAARVLSALLLASAGVLAFISCKKASSINGPHGKTEQAIVEQPSILKNLSHVIAIICAALNMLSWVILTTTIGTFFLLMYPLFISVIGLFGSLLLLTHTKTPVLGSVLIFVSGGVVCFYAPYWLGAAGWWLVILSLLLIAAGVFALIVRKTSASKEPQN